MARDLLLAPTALLLLLLPLLVQGKIPTTVQTLDLHSYSGRWYQVYGNRVTNRTFEKVGSCHSTDIIPFERGIALHHILNKGAPGGEMIALDGLALQGNPKDPGKMIFDYDGIQVRGWYMIMKVGPEVEGKYQYAVVTDAESAVLYVLARDWGVFQDKYEKEVLQFLGEQGFNESSSLLKPIKTPQGGACRYQDPSTVEVEVPGHGGSILADKGKHSEVLAHPESDSTPHANPATNTPPHSNRKLRAPKVYM